MVRGNIGNIKALHDARRPGQMEFLAKFRQVLERLDGGRHAAATGELSSGREGFFEVLEHVAQRGGFLEFEGPGRDLHLLAQAIEQLAFPFPFQNPACLLHSLTVFLLRNAADAGRRTIPDDVRVAMPVVRFARDERSANTQTKAAVQPFERVVQRRGVGKRPEVTRAVVLLHACGHKPRPRIRKPDLRQQETFVVAKSDVIARAVVLDQLAFQQQRLLLVANRVKLEIVDRIDQRPSLEIRPHLLRGHEIR